MKPIALVTAALIRFPVHEVRPKPALWKPPAAREPVAPPVDLIAIAQSYPCVLSSLPYLHMLEMEAFMRRDDGPMRWIRRRMMAIEFVWCAPDPEATS